MEREVSPAEIRMLPIGTKVIRHGHDKYGYPTHLMCEVVTARNGKGKELGYITYDGFERMPIRGNKNIVFTVDETGKEN